MKWLFSSHTAVAAIISQLFLPSAFGFILHVNRRMSSSFKGNTEYSLSAKTSQPFIHRNTYLTPLSMSSSDPSSTSSKAKSTLTKETTWRLRFSMNGIPTTNGRIVNELLFVAEAQFLEEEGYEPPQGSVSQITIGTTKIDTSDDNLSEDKSNALQISSGRWQLSEDPEDRKDGLWIWGLFKEPLYPFMLLQLETKAIQLPGEDNDTIAPLNLYAQIFHTRDKEMGVVLKASVLNIREIESIKADPFGAARVEIYEEKSVGQLSIQPV